MITYRKVLLEDVPALLAFLTCEYEAQKDSSASEKLTEEFLLEMVNDPLNRSWLGEDEEIMAYCRVRLGLILEDGIEYKMVLAVAFIVSEQKNEAQYLKALDRLGEYCFGQLLAEGVEYVLSPEMEPDYIGSKWARRFDWLERETTPGRREFKGKVRETYGKLREASLSPPHPQ